MKLDLYYRNISELTLTCAHCDRRETFKKTTELKHPTKQEAIDYFEKENEYLANIKQHGWKTDKYGRFSCPECQAIPATPNKYVN